MKSLKFSVRVSALLLALILCLFSFSACNEAEENGNEEEAVDSSATTLYVYNWGEYMADGYDDSLDVNAAFEEYCLETLHKKVKVNYSTYASNEDMYAKIKSGSVAYDIIIPSDYMIERMVGEGLLRELPAAGDALNEYIPNYAGIDPAFKGENIYYEGDSYANGKQYSVPYLYGVVGIIYNTDLVDEEDAEEQSWDLMWNEKYKGDILQFNNSRDAFGTALYRAGKSVNSDDDADWELALESLKEQKALLQGYVMDEIFIKMKSNSAAISCYYAGDYLSMYEENEALGFFYPKEGTNYYVDALCIPYNTRNYDLAVEYINFLCSVEIAAENSMYTYYNSPVTAVREDPAYIECMGEEYLDLMYTQSEQIPLESYRNLSDERLARMNEMWEELKVKNSIGVGIYVLIAVIVAALIALVVWQVLKRRRWAKLY